MRKDICKTFSVVLTVALTVSVALPNTAVAKKVVKLSNKKMSIQVGKKKTLKLKNSKKKAVWSIKSGKKYFSLSQKKKKSVVIKGKKVGKGIVQAKVGKKKLTCKVTITAKRAKQPISTPNVTPTATPTGTPVTTPTATPTGTPVTTPSVTPSATPTPTPMPGPTYAPTTFTYQGTSMEGIDTSKPMVAFTFDDGPIGNAETDNSMKIQALLKKYNAHASFFYIGGNISTEGKKNEILQAKENGFDVGNHSWGWSSLNNAKEAAIKDSIGKTNAKLTEITGYDNFLFRAPNLAISKTMLGYINAPFINCAVDSKDWAKASVDDIIKNVKAAKDGDIVLMHETENNTVQALEPLLQYFTEQGYEVVSVTQLFAAKGKKLTTGTQYSSAK